MQNGLDLLKSCTQDSKRKSPIRLTPAEWLERVPCKVYDSTKNKSYLIIATSKEGLWYHDTITMYDEDSFFGDGSYEIDCPALMEYKDLPVDLEFGQEPTEKQVNWLEEHHLMTESMTKQEAWLIINNAVKKASEENKRRKQAYVDSYFRRQFDSMFDDYDIMGQCGGYIDDIDYYDGEAYIDDLYD